MRNVTTFPRQAESPPADARISEIGEILAAGLIRLLAPKSSKKLPEEAENLVDFSAARSGHPTPANRRMPDAR